LIDANPDVIQSNLTKSMTLRCSLNDTDPVPVSGGVIGKRDTQYTPENVQTLTSIVITRNNGDHVASLITGQQPHAQTDLTNIQVNGSLSLTGEPGEEGYIEVTWNYPQTAQVGEYVCEINAITALGHPVTFKDTVEVIETTPSIGQLLGIIQSLDKDKNQMQNQLIDLQSNLSHIQNQPTAPPPSGLHVEQGRIECGDSRNWQRDSNYGEYTTVYHKFNTPYTSTPAINFGVNSLDHEDGATIRYDVTILNKDRNGFTMKCKTWGIDDDDFNNDHSHIYHIWMDWISIA